ncbi:MAG: GntP family permease [Candidatus Symbiothrix sp.]|jgi:GntP family gluconate:H+ symporter|nr:GntP family permease [Candidatus Symbiothrix sp.]
MTAIGAIIGLFVSVILILKKMNAAYSLILGALIGGLAGGIPLSQTVSYMVEGVKDISPAIIRILTAGVLSGVLIKTGAASRIALTIIKTLGESKSLIALVLSAFLLTAIGVFIDVAVITVAPIALSIGKEMKYSKMKVLLAMIGGGKCGNIISPNPNTIIAAENFNASLSSVMYVNLIPAILGLILSVWLVKLISNKGELITTESIEQEDFSRLPSFWSSILGPVVAIVLLALRPLTGIVIDPLIALPVGGLAGILAMRKGKLLRTSLAYGLEKMSVIAVLLIGTGTIAGIIKNSTLKEVILSGLTNLSLGESLIAPISGALMSAVTASTTAGATLASASFADVILAAGISSVWGAAMINSGATVLDHLPHGSFFHATAGSVEMTLKERLKLIGYETAIGGSLAILTVICYLLSKNLL